MAKVTSNEAGTRIGAETTIRAKVSGNEDLVVAGRLEGSIELLGALTVEPTGVVKADVTVVRATILGVVVGDIEASESVLIAPDGRVLGDIQAPRITISEGARFSGSVDMGPVEVREVENARRETPRVVEPPRPIVPPLFNPPPPAPVLKVEEDDEPLVTPALAGGSMRPRPPDGRRKRIVVKKRS